jgi:hypothetical protein
LEPTRELWKKSSNLPTLSRLGFRKKVTVGRKESAGNKTSRKRGRTSSTDAQGSLNGKLSLIQAREGKVANDCAVCSNKKSERRQESKIVLLQHVCKEATTPPQHVYILQWRNSVMYVANRNVLYLTTLWNKNPVPIAEKTIKNKRSDIHMLKH